MRTACFLLVFLMLISSSVTAGDYMLRPGDALSVNVFGYPELSVTEAVIRPDGKLSVPLAGELDTGGLSPGDLSQKIAERLKLYYESPVVAVNVTKFSTARVYVVGEVNRPGLYELDKSRNLMDAIGFASGWTKDAAKTKVFVIHKEMKGEPLRINLMDLLNKGDMSKNIPLAEGDVVYLGQNQRIDIVRDIVPLINAAYYIRYTTQPR